MTAKPTRGRDEKEPTTKIVFAQAEWFQQTKNRRSRKSQERRLAFK
jgi:hypothetical protein